MSRPGFSFLFCPDPELLRERMLQELCSHLSDWRRRTFWADEELPRAYWDTYNQRSLSGQTTALVLRNCEKLTSATWQSVNSLLKRYRSHVWPFFCIESEWSGKNPSVPAALAKQKCWGLAQNRGWVWSSSGLDQQGLRSYIQEWARQRGISLGSGFLRRAMQVLPLDAGMVRRELDKLELWARDSGELTEEDADCLSVEPEMDVFQLLRSLQRGERLAVWKDIIQGRMGTDSAAFLPFLHLLLREARILWQLLFGEEVRLPSWVKREKLQLARSMGPKRLSELWSHVLEAEVGLKSGEWSQTQALDILIFNLERSFSGGSAQTGKRGGRR